MDFGLGPDSGLSMLPMVTCNISGVHRHTGKHKRKIMITKTRPVFNPTHTKAGTCGRL